MRSEPPSPSPEVLPASRTASSAGARSRGEDLLGVLVPASNRESVMADRRTPLTALSILGRRPGVDVRPPRPPPRPRVGRPPGRAAPPAGPPPAAPATETRRASQLIDNAVYSAGRRI